MSSNAMTYLFAIGAIVVGGKAYSGYIANNYAAAEAVIISMEKDCSIEDGNRELVEKETDDTAYMDCDIAPLMAVKFGYPSSAVRTRNLVTYEYVSPADGSRQTGTKTTYGNRLKVGDVRTIVAHTSKPETSKWR